MRQPAAISLRDFSRRTAIAFLLIFACTFAVYSNSFSNSFHFDDFHQIVKNYNIRVFDIRRIFTTGDVGSFQPGIKGYRPVTYTSFAINYALSGYRVWSYHFFNILLHCINALLVYLIAARVFNSIGMDGNNPALFASLLFALHPVQTSAVTYISGRAVLLAAFFGLASFYCFICWRSGKERTAWAAGSIVLFVVGLLSKEFVVCVVVLMLLYDLVVKGKPFRWAIYVQLSVIVGLFVVLRSYMMGPVVPVGQNITVLSYLMSEAKVLLLYVRLMFLPFNQNADYNLKPVTSPDAAVLLSVIAVCAAVYLLYRNRERHPGPVFFVTWFLLALLPESTLVPIADIAEEYRLYFPSIGLIVGGVAALSVYYKDRPVQGRRAAVAMLMLLAVLTFNRNETWATEHSLWTDVARKSPRSARAHFCLGNALVDDRKYNEALREYSKTLMLDPAFPERFGLLNNLGLCYVQTGSLEGAEKAYLASAAENQSQVEAFYNLGKLYNMEGRYGEAEEYLKKAISANPGYSFAHLELGQTYIRLGREDEALSEMQVALHYSPKGFLPNYLIARLYKSLGRYADASGYAENAANLANDENQKLQSTALLEELRHVAPAH